MTLINLTNRGDKRTFVMVVSEAIHREFKTACKSAGLSISLVLEEIMKKYIDEVKYENNGKKKGG